MVSVNPSYNSTGSVSVLSAMAELRVILLTVTAIICWLLFLAVTSGNNNQTSFTSKCKRAVQCVCDCIVENSRKVRKRELAYKCRERTITALLRIGVPPCTADTLYWSVKMCMAVCNLLSTVHGYTGI